MNPEILDHVPPQDLDAERAVLGCILLEGRRLDDVASTLQPEDFHVAAHGTVFNRLLVMCEAAEPVDDLTLLVDRLKAAGEWDQVGGAAALAKLMHAAGAPSNVAWHAEAVAAKAKLRRLRLVGEQIIRAAHLEDDTPAEIAAKSADQLTAIGAAGHATDLVDAADIVRDVLVELDQPERRLGLPTGFYDFDRELGGLYPGELVVLAARPRMGKTSLGLNIATNVAMSGRSVLFVSLEMSADGLARRLLSAYAGVDGNRLRIGGLTDDDKTALAQAANELPLDRLHLTDRSSTTVADVCWTSRRLQRQGKLDLVVVDYLQRLQPADPRARRYEQVGKMSGDLKRLALELGIPVLVLAQLNREVEAKGNHRPQLGHLRESGDIEQDADVVMFLHREEIYSKSPDDYGKAELIVEKNRNGPEAEFKLTWDSQTTTFTDEKTDYGWLA